MRTGSPVVRFLEFFVACHCKDVSKPVYCSAMNIENLIDSFITSILDQKQDHILFSEYEQYGRDRVGSELEVWPSISRGSTAHLPRDIVI
jgi:hypothetical protein